MFGTGIDYEGEIVDLGVKYGVVDKAGSWLSWGEEKLGQGKEGARSFLKANPKVRDQIEKQIQQKVEEGTQ